MKIDFNQKEAREPKEAEKRKQEEENKKQMEQDGIQCKKKPILWEINFRKRCGNIRNRRRKERESLKGIKGSGRKDKVTRVTWRI